MFDRNETAGMRGSRPDEFIIREGAGHTDRITRTYNDDCRAAVFWPVQTAPRRCPR